MKEELQIAVINAAVEFVKIAHKAGCDDFDKLAADFDKAYDLVSEVVKRKNTAPNVDGVGMV